MIAIRYEDLDSTIKTNAQYSVTDEAIFSHASADFESGDYEPQPVVCLDKDGWVPDGTYWKASDEIIASDKMGYQGATMTQGGRDATGSITVIMDNATVLNGILLEFGGQPPEAFTISFFNGSYALLDEDVVEGNKKKTYFASETEAVAKIVVTFVRTQMANQRIRLENIFLGKFAEFSDDTLGQVTADLHATPYAQTLAISTLEIKLKAESEVLFQKKQQIQLWDDDRYIGTFLFTLYEKTSVNEWKIEAESLLGKLEDMEFLGGIYDNYSVAAIIAEIFDSTGITFSILDGLGSETISGWIPICTRREALQQVAFAIGASVIDLYSRDIVIRKSFYTNPAIITEDYQMAYPSITTGTTVTGVKMALYDYQKEPDAEIWVIYAGPALEEQKIVKLESPMYDYAVTGGARVESGANYLIVGAGTTKITGKKYVEVASEASLYVDGIEDDTNVKSVEGAHLITTQNISARLSELFALLVYQNTISADIIARGYDLLDMVSIKTYLGTLNGMLTDTAYTFGRQFHRARVTLSYLGYGV